MRLREPPTNPEDPDKIKEGKKVAQKQGFLKIWKVGQIRSKVSQKLGFCAAQPIFDYFRPIFDQLSGLPRKPSCDQLLPTVISSGVLGLSGA